MSLENRSKELKGLVATYNTDWLLGDLSGLIHAGRNRAHDQLGKLSSPQRQLTYLAGLNVTSDPNSGEDILYRPDKWNMIVDLLNEIEGFYMKLFWPSKPEDVTEEWKRVRMVAMPSFLSYFNLGPLNFEEQVINWVDDLFTPLNTTIEKATGLTVNHFIAFYNTLDALRQRAFQAHTMRKDWLRPDWKSYSKIKMGVVDEAPDFIKALEDDYAPMSYYMTDHGILDRFFPIELVSEDLSLEQVQAILGLLSIKRMQSDFLYYTETRPGNPLFEKPIVDIGGGMYQVFEVKQVIHAVAKLLERICAANKNAKDKYVGLKGDLLEDRIENLFKTFLGPECKIFRSYYVDGREQDILILWRDAALIVEAKGYNIREPMRDPDKAFVVIKDNFNDSIGYGYEQASRVEKKFNDQVVLVITNKKGIVLEEVNTTGYEAFSIIVNLESFGQVQTDLMTLLKRSSDDDVFPWAVKLDDLEIFLLTMIAQKRKPTEFIDFLKMREELHGKLICSDELELCGAFLTGRLKLKRILQTARLVTTHDMGDIFDQQYRKGMGFKNEKMLAEKTSGKYDFW